MSLLFKNHTADELFSGLTDTGLTLRNAWKIQGIVMRRGIVPPTLPEVSLKVLDRIRKKTEVPNLTLVEKLVSEKDGFAKYVFRGPGPGEFEAVRIPLLHRPEDPKYVVCVSSQVGCAMGCAFCCTGKMGFVRNLSAWEIVDQVIKIRDDSQYPVRGVVFMGMGEPFENYDAVMQAARIMHEPCGLAISGKAITISTVGIVPGIRAFTAEKVQYRLVVSLTSANAETRARFLPVEKRYPLPLLIDSLRDYHNATRERVILAWTMMSGINTSEKDALEIKEMTSGLPVKIDLIDVNDPTGRFGPPSTGELNSFRGFLKNHLGMPFSRRYSGGFDIRAACGMLSRATDAEKNESV